jgi:hypothetical protein
VILHLLHVVEKQCDESLQQLGVHLALRDQLLERPGVGFCRNLEETVEYLDVDGREEQLEEIFDEQDDVSVDSGNAHFVRVVVALGDLSHDLKELRVYLQKFTHVSH